MESPAVRRSDNDDNVVSIENVRQECANEILRKEVEHKMELMQREMKDAVAVTYRNNQEAVEKFHNCIDKHNDEMKLQRSEHEAAMQAHNATMEEYRTKISQMQVNSLQTVIATIIGFIVAAGALLGIYNFFAKILGAS